MDIVYKGVYSIMCSEWANEKGFGLRYVTIADQS